MESAADRAPAAAPGAEAAVAAPVPEGSVLVVGGGTMGAGIAQALVQAGVSVRLSEADQGSAAAARDRVAAGLARAGHPEAEDLLVLAVGMGAGSEAGTADVGLRADVTLAIEAVPEDLALKRQVLEAIERAVPDQAVIASNTSSLSVGVMGEGLRHPERFLGMHFFNPVVRSALVEVVTSPVTRDEVVDRARAWVRALG
ncbi:MAG: 3-hydroxyacyl-CoA dehydrogenase family protein, partial [Acidimicrobiales bacterium]